VSDIEYFYAAHSAYAYLGSRRLMEIAAATGRRIVHKPFDLRRGMAAAGATPTKDRTGAHRAYFFGREIERWAEERGVAMLPHRPTHHDNDITLPNCLLIAAQIRGDDIDGLAHALLEAHWRDDADLADAVTLRRLCTEKAIDADQLLEMARSQQVLAAYEGNTEEAIRRFVFGSPTYFVENDMFYGQDRLEMVERALRRPYAGKWPR
jgi:2-hydroxychromene-2-carboxylate isomerase